LETRDELELFDGGQHISNTVVGIIGGFLGVVIICSCVLPVSQKDAPPGEEQQLVQMRNLPPPTSVNQKTSSQKTAKQQEVSQQRTQEANQQLQQEASQQRQQEVSKPQAAASSDAPKIPLPSYGEVDTQTAAGSDATNALPPAYNDVLMEQRAELLALARPEQVRLTGGWVLGLQSWAEPDRPRPWQQPCGRLPRNQ
jgi:hypothetical protein